MNLKEFTQSHWPQKIISTPWWALNASPLEKLFSNGDITPGFWVIRHKISLLFSNYSVTQRTQEELAIRGCFFVFWFFFSCACDERFLARQVVLCSGRLEDAKSILFQPRTHTGISMGLPESLTIDYKFEGYVGLGPKRSALNLSWWTSLHKHVLRKQKKKEKDLDPEWCSDTKIIQIPKSHGFCNILKYL